jgi:hypothetical protein
MSLRQSIVAYPVLPGRSRESARAFLETTLAPRRLVDALEGLMLEGLMSREEVNLIEERVLRFTDREGHWREEPRPRV